MAHLMAVAFAVFFLIWSGGGCASPDVPNTYGGEAGAAGASVHELRTVWEPSAATPTDCKEVLRSYLQEYLNYPPYTCDFISDNEANCFDHQDIYWLSLYPYDSEITSTRCAWSGFRQDYEDDPSYLWRRFACDRRPDHPHDCWSELL